VSSQFFPLTRLRLSSVIGDLKSFFFSPIEDCFEPLLTPHDRILPISPDFPMAVEGKGAPYRAPPQKKTSFFSQGEIFFEQVDEVF